VSRLDRPFVAALLLALAALVRLSYVYAYTFTDESDTLLAGYLISRGAVLYRDIFSHHFPFAYHWVALVIALFGRSIFAVRVSVIVFQLGCLAMAARLTRCYLAVGLTALVWAFVGYLYFGNMALYQSFKAPAVLVVFVTALGVLTRGSTVGRRAALGIGILAAIAVLADLLSVYPLALSFLAMRLAGVRIGRMAVATAVPLVCYAFYLLTTASARDFYADAIAFNADVYSRFTGTSALPLAAFGAKLVRGLGVVDARWLAEGFTLTAPSPGRADHWLFTGLLLRAGVVLLALALLLGRQPLAAGFVYVVAASLQATWGEEGFRAMPFVMVAIFSAVTLVLGPADRAAGGEDDSGTRRRRARSRWDRARSSHARDGGVPRRQARVAVVREELRSLRAAGTCDSDAHVRSCRRRLRRLSREPLAQLHRGSAPHLAPPVLAAVERAGGAARSHRQPPLPRRGRRRQDGRYGMGTLQEPRLLGTTDRVPRRQLRARGAGALRLAGAAGTLPRSGRVAPAAAGGDGGHYPRDCGKGPR
jgi:hypothetical protein